MQTTVMQMIAAETAMTTITSSTTQQHSKRIWWFSDSSLSLFLQTLSFLCFCFFSALLVIRRSAADQVACYLAFRYYLSLAPSYPRKPWRYRNRIVIIIIVIIIIIIIGLSAFCISATDQKTHSSHSSQKTHSSKMWKITLQRVVCGSFFEFFECFNCSSIYNTITKQITSYNSGSNI